MDIKNTIKLLENLKVEFVNETDWIGEVGVDRRKIVLEDKVVSVKPNFTAEEWWDIGTVEGNQYVGGCCSNSSVVQDHISQALISSGWIKQSSLLQIGLIQKDHGGFDMFSLSSEQAITKLENFTPEEFQQLEVWDKLGLIFASLQTILTPGINILPQTDIDITSQDGFNILYQSLTNVSWQSLYEETSPQTACNTNFDKTRILAIVKPLYEHLQQTPLSYSGFLITDEKNNLMSNMRGLAMFETEEEAQELKQLWDKQDTQTTFIKPFTITPEGTLTY